MGLVAAVQALTAKEAGMRMEMELEFGMGQRTGQANRKKAEEMVSGMTTISRLLEVEVEVLLQLKKSNGKGWTRERSGLIGK